MFGMTILNFVLVSVTGAIVSFGTVAFILSELRIDARDRGDHIPSAIARKRQ